MGIANTAAQELERRGFMEKRAANPPHRDSVDDAALARKSECVGIGMARTFLGKAPKFMPVNGM